MGVNVSRLLIAELKIIIEKSSFLAPEIEYLDYLSTNQGIKQVWKKIQAVLDLQQPTTLVKEHLPSSNYRPRGIGEEKSQMEFQSPKNPLKKLREPLPRRLFWTTSSLTGHLIYSQTQVIDNWGQSFAKMESHQHSILEN